jgi:hypothetical protein
MIKNCLMNLFLFNRFSASLGIHQFCTKQMPTKINFQATYLAGDSFRWNQNLLGTMDGADILLQSAALVDSCQAFASISLGTRVTQTGNIFQWRDLPIYFCYSLVPAKL